MIKYLKKKILAFLRLHNRWLCYFPPLTPTGIDLAHDLGFVIENRQPVIFDVGANIGQSIELFQRVHPKCTIYAFEPTAVCYNELSRKSYGPGVKLFQTALGDREETREFYQFEDSVFNSLLPMDRASENRFAHVKMTSSLTTTTRTIDGLINELKLPCIDLLKIDTQGFDYHVLIGASNAIKQARIKVVLVELNFVAMYKDQDDAEAIMSFLTRNGFRLVDLYEKVRQSHAIAWCTALYVRK